jgi:transposase
VCRLHDRAGSPACGRGPKRGLWPGEAIGRSRGGLTTKIHLACDGQGRPLAFTITAGNVNDCTQFEQVMARISVNRCGPGRPRTRPERVVADKGYSSTKIRSYLCRRGIKVAIPERIEPLLPVIERRFRYPGRRRLLCGILFVLYTGIPWRYLPQELGFGSGMTCWRGARSDFRPK